MNRFLVLPLLFIFALSGTIPANIPDTIKQSVEAREYAAAIAELQKLKTGDEKAFTDGDYDYLLARMAEANGDLTLAMTSYQAVASRDSVLSSYALKHLSQIARSTGNLMLERIYLNEILMSAPESLFANAAVKRLANNSFESENYAETISLLTNARSNKPANNANREIQALLAKAYLRDAKTDLTREIFIDLINTTPNPAQPDDFALAAAKGLDLLDIGSEQIGKMTGSLTEAEHMRRANIYQFNREFTDAKLHFEAIIASYPNGANTSDAAFQIGLGYAQQSNYVEALRWFERVIEQYPQSPSAKAALLQAASAYGRVGRPNEATTRYESYIEKYPLDERLDRAYLNIVDILRDQGKDTEALKWCAKIRELFKGKLPEAIAIFTEVRIHLAREQWQNALYSIESLRSFPNLGGSAVPGGTSTAEITFLKGFALEQLKKYPEAIDAYLSIPDGRREYYGWRATERLRLLASDETASSHIKQIIGTRSDGLKAKEADTRRRSAQAILRLTDSPDLRGRTLTVLKTAVEALPKYNEIPDLKLPDQNKNKPADEAKSTIAAKLLSLGLYDEASPEIESATPDLSKLPSDRAFALAVNFTRGNRADRGMAFIEPLWQKVPADYPFEMIPRNHLNLLYPAPYADELLRYAPERGVDPRLVLAIMRQESRFQPDAKSYAAARGLMQFISTTSTRVAGGLGRDNFSQDDLYYPPTAILFGSQYLADLFKIFPNQPEAVAASYNGGDDNMKRWLARARSNSPERYVPEIVYSQSKDYVHKVMASYRMYQYLYDENLRAK